MADLDNFFAKQNKKSKKKSALVAGDLLEQKKREEKEKEKKKSVKNQDSLEPSSIILRKTQEDEDWEDFEDIKVADLADLRLKNLSVKTKSLNETDENSHELNHDENRGNSLTSGNKQDTPWSRGLDGDLSCHEEAENSSKTVTHPEADRANEERRSRLDADVESALSSGKYVPPSLRNRSDDTSSGNTTDDVFRARPLGKGRSGKSAPNIKSDNEFPELGTAPPAQPQTPLSSVTNRSVIINSTPNRYVPPSMRDGNANSSSRYEDYKSSPKDSRSHGGSSGGNSSYGGAWQKRDGGGAGSNSFGKDDDGKNDSTRRPDHSVSNRWAALNDEQ